jgi:hypothetical protein
MGISTFPASSGGGSGSALPYGASALIFSKYSSTGEYTYSTSLSAGVYAAVIYTEDNSRARIEGSSFNAYTSASGLPTYFEIKSTESNVYIGQAATLSTAGWEIKPIDKFPVDLEKVTRNSQGWVYVGTNMGTVVYSTNGTVFSNYSNSSSMYTGPSVITWSTAINRYIMVGSIGQVSLSEDGVVWTTRFNLNFGQINDSNDGGQYSRPYGIRWVNDRFMVFLNGQSTYWSTSGLTWTALNTFTNAGWNVMDVAYGAGKYVATGDSQNNGTFFWWSTNGTTWTTATAQLDTYTEQPRTIVWSGDKFVAPCYENYKINWSTNGTTWSTAVSPKRYMWSIAYGNGVYVATQEETTTQVIWSTNGTTWTTRNVGLDYGNIASYYSQAVMFLNGYFIIGNGGSPYRYSTDGITWTTGTSGSSAGIFAYNGKNYASTNNTSGVGFYPTIERGVSAKITTAKNANVFALKAGMVLGPTTAVLHSLDGANIYWSSNGLSPQQNVALWAWGRYNRWMDAEAIGDGQYAHNANIFVGTQGRVTRGQTNAPTTWSTTQTGSTAGSATLNAVFWDYNNIGAGGYRTYVFSTSGQIYWSTNPGSNAWTNISNVGFSIFNAGIALGQNYIAGGDGGFATTTDYSTWTTRQTNFGTTTIRQVFSSADGSLAMAVGAGGTIRTSTDLITWTSVTANTTKNLNSVCSGTNAKDFYVVGDENTFLYTPNGGATWKNLNVTGTIQGEIAMKKIRFLNGKYIVLSDYGAITASTNGTTWSTVQNLDGQEMKDAVYGNSTYVVGGTWARLYTSADGESWTKRTTVWTSLESINSLAFGANVFIGVGSNGKVSTSTDGITWTTAIKPIDSSDINAVEYFNNLFIIGNSGGTIATSTNGTTWTIRDSKLNNSVLRFAFNNYNTVALDASNNISYSVDGTNWSLFNTATTLASNNNIIYGAGMFITHPESQAGSLNTSLKGNFLDNTAFTQNHYAELRDMVYSNTDRALYGIASVGVIAKQTIPVRNVPTTMFLYNTTVDKVN